MNATIHRDDRHYYLGALRLVYFAPSSHTTSMKTTGIVRRMDELGRVVIPKEMRRTMHLREGEELEIFAAEDGLVLKKYSALSALGATADDFAGVVSELIAGVVYILDTDGVLSSAGVTSHREEGTVSSDVSETLASRKRRLIPNAAAIRGGEAYAHLLVYPLLAHGDLYGALVVGRSRPFDDSAEAVVETACRLLRQRLGD